MQRIGLSARGCAHRTLVCRSFTSNWRHPLPSYQGQGSTRRLSSHDDFWTSAKSEAESTPAYDNATRATPDAAPISSGDGTSLATPGVVGATPQQLPGGAAYRSPYQSDGPRMGRFEAPPAFDMQSPMHLSPVRQIDVRSFKGTTLVDIRQYYKAEDGNVLPTKKGISLTVEQWQTLKRAVADVDRVIGLRAGRRDNVDDGNVDGRDGRDGRL